MRKENCEYRGMLNAVRSFGSITRGGSEPSERNPTLQAGAGLRQNAGMKCLLALALLALPAPALAQQVGDTVQILRSFQTEQHDNRGSTSTTSDTDGVSERVVAMHDGGLELEYD